MRPCDTRGFHVETMDIILLDAICGPILTMPSGGLCERLLAVLRAASCPREKGLANDWCTQHVMRSVDWRLAYTQFSGCMPARWQEDDAFMPMCSGQHGCRSLEISGNHVRLARHNTTD